ncbi:MAG: ATPase domain-containing protein [Candidatus Bathyarchaeia archaeon]
MVPTGCGSLDKLLDGGFPADRVSLVYGEAETGKSSLAVQCAVNCARMGYKSIFIDADGTFSSKRLSQIAYYDYEKISPLIILMRPTTFQEQVIAIDHLDEYITKKFGLIVVDTITSLYRTELGNSKQTFALNRELNGQVAFLAQIARAHKIAALITSQVRSIFVEDQVGVEPVATRVLKFWSDVVLNLKHTGQTRVIKALLEKHPERKRSMSCYVKIEKTGIRDYRR